MSMTSLSRALRAHLTHDNDPSVDARAIAARLHHLLTQLEPPATQLIGLAGFRALYARSVHLNRRAHPWCSASSLPDAETPFAAIEACIVRQEPQVAAVASIDLLLTLTQLLGTFIGDHLTIELVKHAWPGVLSDGPPQESSHE